MIFFSYNLRFKFNAAYVLYISSTMVQRSAALVPYLNGETMQVYTASRAYSGTSTFESTGTRYNKVLFL